MSSPLPILSLPSINSTHLTNTPDSKSQIDPEQIAKQWFQKFSSALGKGNVDDRAVEELFWGEGAIWRDILSLSWDFRSFYTSSKILPFLKDRLPAQTPHSFNLQTKEKDPNQPVTLHFQDFKLPDDEESEPRDVAYIQGFFEFQTKIAKNSGVFRLVPVEGGKEWKAWTVFTLMEDLLNHPELINAHRPSSSDTHGTWEHRRAKELEFENNDPQVVILGGGQSGLDLAARLGCLGVRTLIVEKKGRVGDQWRTRYKALKLHDWVYYDHLPYMPFPSNWPEYTPAPKLANWLEHFSESMELNIWLSSTIDSATYEAPTNGKGAWTVQVTRTKPDGKTVEKRTLKAGHLVVATGIGGGLSYTPEVEGMDQFKGKVYHSAQHDTAAKYQGKKIAVIGSGTSSHDICKDFADHNIDVTMVQRNETYIMSVKNGIPTTVGTFYYPNGPPTEIADRLNASFPFLIHKHLAIRDTNKLKVLDEETLEGLKKVGFKVGYGPEGAGFVWSMYLRAGGYYLDVGASQDIIDGKIKLKPGEKNEIERFTENGLKFKDGSELEADVVIFATAFGDMRESIRPIVGNEVTDQLRPLWGFNEEFEPRTAWRNSGHPGIWFMMGNLMMCRFHSKHVALQIKAIEEGIFKPEDRYELIKD